MVRSKNLNISWLALVVVITVGCTTSPPTKLSSKTQATLEPNKTIYWKTHNSSLGFRIDLPSHYVVLSREELKKNPDLIEGMYEIAKGIWLKSADKNVVEQMKIMTQSGLAEYYFNQNYPRVIFSVLKSTGKIPQTHAEAKKRCEKDNIESEKLLGITIKVDECALRNVAGLNGWYSVLDMPGIRGFERIKLVQCIVQISPAIQLLFGGMSEDQPFEITKKEFDEIMESLKLSKEIGE